MSLKIMFVKNRLVDYIIPWLNLVSKEVDLELVLTHNKKENLHLQKKSNPKFKITNLSSSKLLNKYSLPLSLIPKLLKTRSEVIVSSDPHTLESLISFSIAKLTGKKFVLWNETFSWPRSPKSKLIQPFVDFLIKHSDSTMAVGKKSKEYLQQKKAKKIFITPYTTIHYPIKKFNLPLPKDKQIILYLSRIVNYKGLDILVRAFSKLKTKNTFLLICGDGPKKNNIKNLISKLGLKDYLFLDRRINNNEKGHIYSSADVLVLPSTFRDYDADCWGLVLNEAMSYSKPVISTNATGGAHDLIKNGINGYIVPQKNPESLAQALDKILSNKNLKQKMGKESLKIINSNHTYEKMAQNFLAAVKFS